MITANCVLCHKPAEVFLDKEAADAAFPVCEDCLKNAVQTGTTIILNKISRENITLPFEIIKFIIKFTINPYVIICIPEVYEKYLRLRQFILTNKT
ncbi:MAG TPA: hypothetical protein PKN48_00160 [Bacteroidales bacterium]|mgnify:CR=1 FL=1|nr:hypothetical protein [Bacteroidales bacterium]